MALCHDMQRGAMTREEDGWRRFLELCLKTRSRKELDALMGAFLTHTERKEIAFRALIFRELLNGEKTQREIARDLPVSIAKVTRGSNNLKTIDPEVRSALAS